MTFIYFFPNQYINNYMPLMRLVRAKWFTLIYFGQKQWEKSVMRRVGLCASWIIDCVPAWAHQAGNRIFWSHYVFWAHGPVVRVNCSCGSIWRLLWAHHLSLPTPKSIRLGEEVTVIGLTCRQHDVTTKGASGNLGGWVGRVADTANEMRWRVGVEWSELGFHMNSLILNLEKETGREK